MTSTDMLNPPAPIRVRVPSGDGDRMRVLHVSEACLGGQHRICPRRVFLAPLPGRVYREETWCDCEDCRHAARDAAEAIGKAMYAVATCDDHAVAAWDAPVYRAMNTAFRAAVQTAYGPLSDLMLRRVRDVWSDQLDTVQSAVEYVRAHRGADWRDV